MLRKIEGMARAGMTQEEILSSTTLQQMAATQLEKGGTELADDLKANPPPKSRRWRASTRARRRRCRGAA